MLINKINTTNFKAIYEDKNYISSSNDNRIKSDITNKLYRPYPNDAKKRNYVDYLKEEKDIDILLKKEMFHPIAITVMGVKNAKNNGDKIVDCKSQFKVGDYFIRNFNPDDVLEVEKQQKQLDAMKILSYVLLVLTAILFAVNLKYRHDFNKLGYETEMIIEKKNAIPDSLKFIK